jgi:hypothetical protein
MMGATMLTADDFRSEMYRMMHEAMREGRKTADINAGELHRRVGDYPAQNDRMSLCCEVMNAAFAPDAGDVILEKPPDAWGGSLTIRYSLPKAQKG